MNSSRIYTIIISIICLGLITAFSYYLYANADKYLSLFRLSPIAVCFLFILSLMLSILNGIINTYLFRSLGAEISHQDGFLLAAATSLANLLPISGGIIFKGFYLKRKFDLSYTKFLSATLALFICLVAVNGFIGIAILLYWILFKSIVVSPFLLIGFGAMSACLSVFWLPLGHKRIPDRIRKWIHEALEGWMIISKTPSLVGKLVGLQASQMMLLAVQYWITFHMLSQNVNLSQSLLFSSASVLNQLVSIAPGGLGVTEAIVGGVALTLGFDVGVSVVALGLYRLVSTFTIVLIGGISTVVLGKQTSKIPIKPGRQET